MNSRVVGWGQDDGALAYDRKLKEVVRLSNLYDFYPVVSDSALDWIYQPGRARQRPVRQHSGGDGRRGRLALVGLVPASG